MIRNQLLTEAVTITKELGNLAFIGAVAVFLQTNFKTRESQDLDFALATPIPRHELLKKGYKIVKDKTYSPRGRKVDIYHDEPINDIPIERIVGTAIEFSVGRNQEKVKAASLEVLIVMKKRAQREQDNQDLHSIARAKYHKINWNVVKALVVSDYEYKEIEMTVKTLKDIPE